MRRQFDFIDLFAGGGDLSLGLEQAGFRSVFVNEIMPQFAGTYRINASHSQIYYINDKLERIENHMKL